MFFELETVDFERILPLYLQEQTVFPLILAVIRRQQRGWVFADNLVHPTCAMIINNFGFMQFMGAEGCSNDLMDFLKLPTPSIPSYLLWYSPPPQIQAILMDLNDRVRLRERARFIYKRQDIKNQLACPNGAAVQLLDKEWIKKSQGFNLNISSRFWTSVDDYLEHGIGTCVVIDGKVASLCYSACVVDGLAEIDIVTQEEYRGLGFASIVAQSFIIECIRRGITPTWDCFVNNTASMKLAAKLGFEKEGTYPFYSFNLPLTFSTEGDDHEVA